MNLSFIGNIAKAPDLRYAPSGASYTFFTVAMNTTKKHDPKNKIVWWSCVAFQDIAEDIAIGFKKGDLISITKAAVNPIKDKRTGGEQLQVVVYEAVKPG